MSGSKLKLDSEVEENWIWSGIKLIGKYLQIIISILFFVQVGAFIITGERFVFSKPSQPEQIQTVAKDQEPIRTVAVDNTFRRVVVLPPSDLVTLGSIDTAITEASTNQTTEPPQLTKSTKVDTTSGFLGFLGDYGVICLLVLLVFTCALVAIQPIVGVCFILATTGWYTLIIDAPMDSFFFGVMFFVSGIVICMLGLVTLMLPFILLNSMSSVGGEIIDSVGDAGGSFIDNATDFATNNPITTGFVASKIIPKAGELAEKHPLGATLTIGALLNKMKK